MDLNLSSNNRYTSHRNCEYHLVTIASLPAMFVMTAVCALVTVTSG